MTGYSSLFGLTGGMRWAFFGRRRILAHSCTRCSNKLYISVLVFSWKAISTGKKMNLQTHDFTMQYYTIPITLLCYWTGKKNHLGTDGSWSQRSWKLLHCLQQLIMSHVSACIYTYIAPILSTCHKIYSLFPNSFSRRESLSYSFPQHDVIDERCLDAIFAKLFQQHVPTNNCSFSDLNQRF